MLGSESIARTAPPQLGRCRPRVNSSRLKLVSYRCRDVALVELLAFRIPHASRSSMRAGVFSEDEKEDTPGIRAV